MNIRQLTVNEMQKPGKVLIDKKHLLEKVPLSERTILNMEKRGEFPRRFSITKRRVAWDLQEVDAWMNGQQLQATQPAAPGRLAA